MTTFLLLDSTALFGSMPPMNPRDVADDDGARYLINVLLILSLAFASVSMVATLPTLYWFVRIRRSFRHELILLLIQSDLLKSMAYLIFPIVSLAKGTVQSDSAFCQLSGVALTIGIEAADIAVLLIALHSVMYIFRPRSGLYPYRRIAYSAFYLFPVATACLAFISGNGYENVGPYCYLLTDRTWSRLMLSWVPRYVICASIALIYAFIYLYIWKRMGDYGRRSSEAAQQRQLPTTSRSGSAPTIPRICYHGLIPSTPSSRRTSAVDTVSAAKDRQRSASSASTTRTGTSSTNAEIQWNWTGFTQPRSPARSNPLTADDPGDPLSPRLAPVSSPPPARDPQPRAATVADGPLTLSASEESLHHHAPLPSSPFRRPRNSSASLDATSRGRSSRRSHALRPLLSRLQKIRTRATSPATTTSTSSPILLLPPAGITEDYPYPYPSPGSDGVVSQQRDRVRRQLRSLLAYPLAYMVVWLFPFVAHVMGRDGPVKYEEDDDLRWLPVVGVISLCVQGAVDCALFMLREKPWRHAAAESREGRGGGFLGSLLRWSRVGGRGAGCCGSGCGGGVAGRTREERLLDGRLARQRREGEIVVEQRAAREWSVGKRRRAVREWWDLDLDLDRDEDDDRDDDNGSTGEEEQGHSGQGRGESGRELG